MRSSDQAERLVADMIHRALSERCTLKEAADAYVPQRHEIHLQRWDGKYYEGFIITIKGFDTGGKLVTHRQAHITVQCYEDE